MMKKKKMWIDVYKERLKLVEMFNRSSVASSFSKNTEDDDDDDCRNYSHEEFLARYRILAVPEVISAKKKGNVTAVSLCTVLIKNIHINLDLYDDSNKSIKKGESVILIKEKSVSVPGYAWRVLEKNRDLLLQDTAFTAKKFLEQQSFERRNIATTKIQKFYRRWIAMRKYQTMQRAVVVISCAWRVHAAKTKRKQLSRVYIRHMQERLSHTLAQLEESNKILKQKQEETRSLRFSLQDVEQSGDRVFPQMEEASISTQTFMTSSEETIYQLREEQERARKSWEAERAIYLESIKQSSHLNELYSIKNELSQIREEQTKWQQQLNQQQQRLLEQQQRQLRERELEEELSIFSDSTGLLSGDSGACVSFLPFICQSRSSRIKEKKKNRRRRPRNYSSL